MFKKGIVLLILLLLYEMLIRSRNACIITGIVNFKVKTQMLCVLLLSLSRTHLHDDYYLLPYRIRTRTRIRTRRRVLARSNFPDDEKRDQPSWQCVASKDWRCPATEIQPEKMQKSKRSPSHTCSGTHRPTYAVEL